MPDMNERVLELAEKIERDCCIFENGEYEGFHDGHCEEILTTFATELTAGAYEAAKQACIEPKKFSGQVSSTRAEAWKECQEAIRSLTPESAQKALERVKLEAGIEGAIKSWNIAAQTPFRAHSADDLEFHSGCVQTREGIVKAIRKFAESERSKLAGKGK